METQGEGAQSRGRSSQATPKLRPSYSRPAHLRFRLGGRPHQLRLRAPAQIRDLVLEISDLLNQRSRIPLRRRQIGPLRKRAPDRLPALRRTTSLRPGGVVCRLTPTRGEDRWHEHRLRPRVCAQRPARPARSRCLMLIRHSIGACARAVRRDQRRRTATRGKRRCVRCGPAARHSGTAVAPRSWQRDCRRVWRRAVRTVVLVSDRGVRAGRVTLRAHFRARALGDANGWCRRRRRGLR